jgi:hypothetical protein
MYDTKQYNNLAKFIFYRTVLYFSLYLTVIRNKTPINVKFT